MNLSDIQIIEKDFFKDTRGELWTTWKPEDFSIQFNHDKVSTSNKNVIRGLHGDTKSHKLISCIYGEIYFVVVDNRKDSETYLKWDSFILNDLKKQFILLPPNFANGFAVLSDIAVFNYKWAYPGKYPDVNDQFSLNWKDPKLDIPWPIKHPILSDRDKNSKFI